MKARVTAAVILVAILLAALAAVWLGTSLASIATEHARQADATVANVADARHEFRRVPR